MPATHLESMPLGLPRARTEAALAAANPSTSYAYRDLLRAFMAYADVSARRDIVDVWAEMDHLRLTILRERGA